MDNKKIKPLLFIFGVMTFFIFIISFTVFYTTENFSSSCGCKLPIWVIIVSISSLSLFVGIITYYILINHFLKEKKEIEKNILNILSLLDRDEQRIIKHFIENKGEINQSSLSKYLGVDKVKNSRIISKLESKGIIKKEKNGMTNKLILNNDLKDLFIN